MKENNREGAGVMEYVCKSDGRDKTRNCESQKLHGKTRNWPVQPIGCHIIQGLEGSGLNGVLYILQLAYPKPSAALCGVHRVGA